MGQFVLAVKVTAVLMEGVHRSSMDELATLASDVDKCLIF